MRYGDRFPIPSMKVAVSEIMNAGKWDDFCKIRGWNIWAVNEGRMSSDEIVTLTGATNDDGAVSNRKQGI